GEVFPGAGDPAHLGLAAQLALGAYLLGNAGYLCRERVELIDHRVDRALELEHFTFGVDGDLLGKVAFGDCSRDERDVADLPGQIAGHEIDVVGEILPDARNAFHVGLAAELPVGAYLLGDAGHLCREGVELIDHRVDGALQLEHLAAGVDGNLLGKVASSHRGGD